MSSPIRGARPKQGFGMIQEPAISEGRAERLDPNVLIMYDAAGVVALQRNGAARADPALREISGSGPAFRLCPPYDLLVIQLDSDRVSLNQDILGEPLAIFDKTLNVLCPQIDYVVQAATFYRI